MGSKSKRKAKKEKRAPENDDNAKDIKSEPSNEETIEESEKVNENSARKAKKKQLKNQQKKRQKELASRNTGMVIGSIDSSTVPKNSNKITFESDDDEDSNDDNTDIKTTEVTNNALTENATSQVHGGDDSDDSDDSDAVEEVTAGASKAQVEEQWNAERTARETQKMKKKKRKHKDRDIKTSDNGGNDTDNDSDDGDDDEMLTEDFLAQVDSERQQRREDAEKKRKQATANSHTTFVTETSVFEKEQPTSHSNIKVVFLPSTNEEKRNQRFYSLGLGGSGGNANVAPSVAALKFSRSSMGEGTFKRSRRTKFGAGRWGKAAGVFARSKKAEMKRKGDR